MITHLVSNIIDCEKSLENIRYQLNQDSLFSLQPIMTRLDQKNKSFIDTEDLIAFCSENDVECTQIEAYYALKYLDTNKDGIVNFQDLCSQLLPKTNHKQRTITALREPYIVEQKMHLPEQIESGLAVFFGELLIFIKEQQKIKKELKVNIYQILQDIDKENKCKITLENFKDYFQLSIQDTQYFFMAAQQSSGMTELSYMELMDCLLNFDSSDCPSQMAIIDRSSPLKLNPLQKIEDQQQQDSPKFQTEKIKQNYQNDEDAATIKMNPRLRNDEVNELSQFQSEDNFRKLVKNTGLYRYLTKIIMNSKLIEQAQLKLVQRSDVNVRKLFTLFSGDNGYIKEMFSGLKKFQIIINSQVSNFIMQQYGENNIMTFEQFQGMLGNACENECDFDNSTTNNYIKELFETIIKTEIAIRQCRPTTPIYQYLDPTGQGYFGINELKEFFRIHQAYPTNQELELIFKRFKGDNILYEQQFTQL